METIRNILFVVALAFAGCSPTSERVVKLNPPPKEMPPVNLPAALHQENWLGKLNQGSCVHASLTNNFRWHNMHEFGEYWRGKYSDGEYDSRLRKRLDEEGVRYVYTVKADPRFLDWASATRHGCILWWKPQHCCHFQGWVEQNGVQYAAVLDPNRPGKFELTPRDQFIRLWAGYGGFALTVISSPPAAQIPWPSYEVVN